MKNMIRTLLFSSIIFSSTSLHAYVPVADTVLGEAIDKTLLLAGKSSFEQFKKYNLINDQRGLARVKKIVKNIGIFSGIKLRYPNPTIRIIEGDDQEANAYSLGPVIYVTKEILEILDDAELTAVMAHEIAHSEEGHMLARMVYTMGSPVLHLRNLIFSDIYLLSTGEADEQMEKILNQGHMALIREILEGATVRQEMQADCIAANWLARARSKGWKLSPLDLNRATNTIFGMDIGKMEEDETFPPLARYNKIRSGKYIGSACRL